MFDLIESIMDPSNDDAAPTSSNASPPAVESNPSTLTQENKDHLRKEPPSLIQAAELRDSALNYLATASNESLGCLLGALAIATYIILGRVGLLLIGLLLGVVLHASWEGKSDGAESEVRGRRNPWKRRELALEVANRLLTYKTTEENVGVAPTKAEKRFEYSACGQGTSAALDSLVEAVIRDYVL